MSLTLRQALREKISRLPEWKQFCEDFAVVTGLRVQLVDELGMTPEGLGCGNATLCAHLMADACGRRLCQSFRQRLLIEGKTAAAEGCCDAGLRELVLPLRLGGVGAGFLLVAGFGVGEMGVRERGRGRHLLAKAGVRFSKEVLESEWNQVPRFSLPVWAAYARWVEMAAREICHRLRAHVTVESAELPPAVEKAIRLIRTGALQEELSLPHVARQCGVCAGHLSRLFVRSTGLSYTEFVTRFRIEHAAELLRKTNKPVTEVAFESGFSSLSQFHRAFRRVQGCAPREYREACLLGEKPRNEVSVG